MQAVTDATFEQVVLESDIPVVVDFWAPWCGPCRMLAPILEEVAEELGDSVLVAKVNTDENQESARQYGVMSIPTLVIFNDGEEVGRLVGVRPKAELVEAIKASLK